MIINIANSLKGTNVNGPMFSEYKDKLREMLFLATRMTRGAIDAFVKSENVLAKEVIDLDDDLDELYHVVHRGLPRDEADKMLSQKDLTDILSINGMAYNIERIGDHATNIAESAIYLIHGQDVKHLGHENDASDLIAASRGT